MSRKQCQMQPYRAAKVADTADAPSVNEKAAFLIESFGFDGVRFDYVFVCDGNASATLEAWFYDSQNERWIPDTAQNKAIGAVGSGTFRVETSGRPMLLKIRTLTLPAGATPPYLLITQGAYADSKV